MVVETKGNIKNQSPGLFANLIFCPEKEEDIHVSGTPAGVLQLNIWEII